MNIQTDTSEKIELHGPLSFKWKKSGRTSSGISAVFFPCHFWARTWGLNGDCSLVIILVLQKLKCKGTRQGVTTLRWHLLSHSSCFWRVSKSSVIISLSKAHFFLNSVLQTQSTYGSANYSVSCLAHRLFFTLWSPSLFKSLAFEALSLSRRRITTFLWIGGFICLHQDDWALTDISSCEAAPAGTAPWYPARMASAVVCCFSIFKHEPLPLLSHRLCAHSSPASYLIWVSSIAEQNPDFFSCLPVSEACLKKYLRIKLESGSRWALLCGWCFQALYWGI